MQYKNRMIEPEISIHALREEGDREDELANVLENISIHALREEGDHDCTERAGA